MDADDPDRPRTLPSGTRLAAWLAVEIAVIAVGVLLAVDAVAASNAAVGLGNATREQVSVPRWLYLLTGGAVIGASGLLASVVTDRALLRAIHAWRRVLPARATLFRWLARAGRLVGLAALALVIVRGVTGPQFSTVSFATVVVFAGARAGLTMVAYLVGNPWPVLNPWRTLADAMAVGPLEVGPLRSYPERWGIWPATGGLLALVYVESVTRVTGRPETLALAVVCYTGYTLAGAIVVGPKDWFRFGDPIAVLFRQYGRVAPLQRGEDGLELRLPGAALVQSGSPDPDTADSDATTDDHADPDTADTDTADDRAGPATPRSDIAGFAIALIWELTFSGFVTTQLGTDAIAAATGVVPGWAITLGFLMGGYALLYGLYWLAAWLSHRRIDTYRSAREIGAWLAPSLLAIAAGYHLAHYFWLFVTNLPTLAGALATPFSPPANPIVLAPPGWASGLNIGFVLLGHLLAVWVAHARSYRLFPGRLQAIRSQHPFVAVMIVYTVLSLWLLSLPAAG